MPHTVVSDPRTSCAGEEERTWGCVGCPNFLHGLQSFSQTWKFHRVSKSLTMRSSFGDLTFSLVFWRKGRGERVGKLPSGCCLTLAVAFLLSTVRFVKQEKVSGTCLDQGSRLTALSDG